VSTFAGLVCRHARAIFAAGVLGAALLAVGVPFLTTRVILEGELPSSDPIVAQTEEFKARHPDRNFYVIGIDSGRPDGIWDPRVLAAIVEISTRAAHLPGAMPNVQSLATWQHVTATDDDTIHVRALMPAAPSRPEDIAALRAIVQRSPLVLGRLVSDDGAMAIVRVRFRDDATQSTVSAGLEELRADFGGVAAISILGRHHINEAIDHGMNEHVSLVLPVALLLILVFQYLAFGRWQAVGMTAAVLALNVIGFVGMMGLLGIPQSVLSSGVPVLLVISTGSFIEHMLARVYEEAEHHPWPDAVALALSHTGPAVALAAVTTSLGFGSLATFAVYSVREFGILAAVGVAIGGILSLAWLPAALLVVSRQAPREHHAGRSLYLASLQRLIDAAVNVAAGMPRRRARVVAAVLLAFALVGLTELRVGTNPTELFPRGHDVRISFDEFLARFHGNGFISMGIQAPPGADIYDPAFLERTVVFQRAVTTIPGVGYAISLADAVLMRLNRTMHDDDPAEERLPGSRKAAAQFVELYRWSAAETLVEMIDDAEPPRELVMDVFMRVNDSAVVADVVDRIEHTFAETFPTPDLGRLVLGGEWVLWIAQNRYIVWGKILNILTAAPFVAFLCLLTLRDRRLALLSLIPSLYATVLVFGTMGPLGIRLDITSCTITAIVIGMGTDFAVHLLVRHREAVRSAPPGVDAASVRAAAIRSAGPPITFDAITNIAAFSVCILSPFAPMQTFGILMCLSMAGCLVATLGLLPGLLTWVESGRVTR